MVTRSQKVRLGVFIFLTLVIFIALAALLAGRKVFEKKDDYYISYKDISVSGLDAGTQVKYHGIRVGSINEIKIDPEDVTRVIVHISLDEGTPVKEDVRAVISSIGVTGLKIIELVGGSNEAETLTPGSFVVPGESPLDAITGKAEIIAEKAELVLTNLANATSEINREKAVELLDNMVNLTEELGDVVSENRDKVSSILGRAENVASGAEDIVTQGRETIGQINSLMTSLGTTIAEIEALGGEIREVEIDKAVARLSDAAEQASTTLTHLDLTILKGRSDLLASLESLRESMDYFNEFTRMISENPSLVFRASRIEEIPSNR